MSPKSASTDPAKCIWRATEGWQRVEVPALTYERARQFCTAVVNESNTGQRITDTDPVVSLTFPTGQRAQFVIPPACDAGKVSITIRLPSKHTQNAGTNTRRMDSSTRSWSSGHGLSDQDRELLELRALARYAEFFRKAVLCKKNIVVSGATGSGKTTFMKSLVNHIPADERLVTIEDARELFIEPAQCGASAVFERWPKRQQRHRQELHGSVPAHEARPHHPGRVARR